MITLWVPHNLSPAPEQDPDLSLPDTLLHPLAARFQPLTFQHPFLFLHLWTKLYPSLWLSSAHPDLATFLYKYHYPETVRPVFPTMFPFVFASYSLVLSP
uniref:Uncharacterized protein n=2 Tax=Nothobranchius kuhntae TaxID=321403 RepID=A0A1A8HWK2_NOTKU